MTTASVSVSPAGLRPALRARLVAALETLGVPVAAQDSVEELLQRLALHAKHASDDSTRWLTFVSISGCFPSADEFDDLRRGLDLASDGGAMVAALGATMPAAIRSSTLHRELRVVVGAVVVDVNFCATYEHNTGIQRVVRQTIPRWVDAGHDLTLVAWTDDGEAMRELNAIEQDRVLHWNDRRHPDATPSEGADPIVVPWKSNVFLPEVPFENLCAPLTALAEFSGNRVSAIGYDAIPLVSADSQRAEESQRFAKYLTLIKHVDAVFGISESAASEFSGFVSALAPQDITGPQVVSIPLAVGTPSAAGAPNESTRAAEPLVVCVGSHEPRKNQDAVLHAARVLYRQGQKFRMVFVGGGDRANLHEFDRRVQRMRKSGFDISSRRSVSDAELWALYSEARFSVFISLHEGFGLPVAESLALGTPVLTSNFGSLAELAEGGGCVTVDPRSDDQIIAAMRKLLTEDQLIAQLRAQALKRPPRDWDDYARELWAAAGFDRTVE